jgi:hypothetical protein
MIARWIFQVEWHWGYPPIVSFRRAPRPGDRVMDGGVSGHLTRCPLCGEGHLHVPDSLSESVAPEVG